MGCCRCWGGGGGGVGDAAITGGHVKQNLRPIQKYIYFALFTNTIWSYLLWSPVAGVMAATVIPTSSTRGWLRGGQTANRKRFARDFPRFRLRSFFVSAFPSASRSTTVVCCRSLAYGGHERANRTGNRYRGIFLVCDILVCIQRNERPIVGGVSFCQE